MTSGDTSATRSSRLRAPIALLWALIGIAVAVVPQARTGLAADALARCLSSESAIAALGLATGAALFKEAGDGPERHRYAAVAFAIAAVFMATTGFALPSRISRNIVAFLWGLIESALLGQTAQRERWGTYLALLLTELSALVTLGWIGETASDAFVLIAGQAVLLVMLFALLKLRQRKPAPSNDLSKSPPTYDTARLTEREREVVERLSRNETQVEIAKSPGSQPLNRQHVSQSSAQETRRRRHRSRAAPGFNRSRIASHIRVPTRLPCCLYSCGLGPSPCRGFGHRPSPSRWDIGLRRRRIGSSST